MKSLIISIACLAMLVALWGTFNRYSDAKLDGYIDLIGHTILPAIAQEDWEAAASAFAQLSDDWNSYKRIATFFFDRALVNEADFSIARTKHFIQAKDVSNSTGELGFLIQKFAFFHTHDSFHPANIF